MVILRWAVSVEWQGQNPAGADSKENSRDEIGESRNCFKNFFSIVNTWKEMRQ